MAKVTFSVRPDLLKWGSDYGEYLSADNPHEVDADLGLQKQVAAAAAQGSLVDVSGMSASAESSIESDEDSLKTQAKAMESGVWQEGQTLQAEIDEAAKAAALEEDEG